ncbi:ATP-dependent RNA helicase RhlE [Chitinophaga costaii]|uniref:ATP-dependent RNA helicase RhlE n=1 Tax=Chitinophaga costaii TaxID=1335309 RepID=A0A1C4F043_9BACT|nr:DEAD/DEAH box helicase [Chitinophaga costaii]PUZ21514.1 ATP-dependent helicase [Chitinophaga costaii]SCC49045.1 ATP-dependent RNA helicase RhlE [Chitinophaga costaii]
MTFADLNLNKPLLNALQDLGYTTPTTIQHRAFSAMMSGRDVCGIAQTGTGKTFAYLLPILRQWEFSKDRFPTVLIMVPTRELVAQVVESVHQLTPYLRVVTEGFYGGVNMNPQMDRASQKIDIVVATPGRLVDLILSGALKMKAIKKVVIDEVDEMLNLGFRTQIKHVLDLLPLRRQNTMFSATITDEVQALIQTFFNEPLIIEAAPAGSPLANIQQIAYEVPNFNTKVNLLEKMLREDATMTKVLVFAATKALADDLFEKLEPAFPGRVGVIHSNKEQNHRFNTVKQFQEGNYRFIIATDIIARGLDVAEVSHVVNLDAPEVPEDYIHRIGRTGRADRPGVAILFKTEQEQPLVEKIEALMHYQIPTLPLPADVEISNVLIESELPPPLFVKNVEIRLPKAEPRGPAFHEKKAKNKKVNVKVSHKDKMKAKYGKPKKRGAKKK